MVLAAAQASVAGAQCTAQFTAGLNTGSNIIAVDFASNGINVTEVDVDWLSAEFTRYYNADGSIRLPTASVSWNTSLDRLIMVFETTCLNVSTLSNVVAGGAWIIDGVSIVSGRVIVQMSGGGAGSLILTFDSVQSWPDYAWQDTGSGGGGAGSSGDWGLGGLVGTLIDAARLLLTLALDALVALLQVYPLLFALLSLKYWVSGDFEGWLEFIYMHINAARTLLRFILDIIDQILPT